MVDQPIERRSTLLRIESVKWATSLFSLGSIAIEQT